MHTFGLALAIVGALWTTKFDPSWPGFLFTVLGLAACAFGY